MYFYCEIFEAFVTLNIYLIFFFSVLWLKISGKCERSSGPCFVNRGWVSLRLFSCCCEQLNTFSQEAVRVGARTRGAGPEERQDGGDRIWTDEPV